MMNGKRWTIALISGVALVLFLLLLGGMFFLPSTYRCLNAPYGLLLVGVSCCFYLPYVFLVVSISSVNVHGRWLNKVVGIVVLIAALAGSLSDYCVPNRMSVHWKDRMLELKKTGKTSIQISAGDDRALNL